MNFKLQVIPFFLIVIMLSGCKEDNTKQNQQHDIYSVLQDVLNERKEQLANYMNDSKALSKKIQHDHAMVSFFEMKRQYYYLKKDTILPAKLIEEIEKLKENIQYHYIMNYQSFYDILFIDTRGEIFYTIRKQADYQKNIFEGDLAHTALSKKLKDAPRESFVDFQFYEISGEPSAFFIEPVLNDGKTVGWFVMQLSTNQINNLFSINERLGATGEVVLVNKDHYLLTNSRFKNQPTILKQQLPDENIDAKFQERSGKKTVVDYRGKEVHSVFDVFEFFNSEWLIIAKIDKNEVITQQYRHNKKKYFSELKSRFNFNELYSTDIINQNDQYVYVDMNEYHRGSPADVLCTQGVSSCTAVNICLPGQFSYLVHVSPYDVIYNESRTDLLAQIFKQITFFEITESEKQQLEIHIMTTQLNSIEKLIDKIIDNGYFLSQIKFCYNPYALYGNIYSDCSENKVWVNWKMDQDQGADFIQQDFKNIPSMENILVEIKTKI